MRINIYGDILKGAMDKTFAREEGLKTYPLN